MHIGYNDTRWYSGNQIIAKQVGCILVRRALDKIVIGYSNLFDKFDILQWCHTIQYTLNMLSYIITNLSVRDDLED